MSKKEWEKVKKINYKKNKDEKEFEYFVFRGLLPLLHKGCTYGYNLVLSGKYKGKMVITDLSYIHEPFFKDEDNFLDWYEKWLDEIILMPDTIEPMKDEPIVHKNISKLHRFYRAIKRIFGR